MGLSTMESGYLDSHDLGHVVCKIMLARNVSKSQQCCIGKDTFHFGYHHYCGRLNAWGLIHTGDYEFEVYFIRKAWADNVADVTRSGR